VLQHLLEQSLSKTAWLLVPFLFAASCQPALLPAQDHDANLQPGVTAARDWVTVQQLAERLEAAEAEIRALRQQSPTGEAAVNFASAGNDSFDFATHSTMNQSGDAWDEVEFLTPHSQGECGVITFKPGVRIQSRFLYNDFDNNNDFFVRRFRLKGKGNVFGMAQYGTELKVDSTGRVDTDPEPEAIVENAWLEFEIVPESVNLRVGLYDAPFSRSSLQSDSDLLFMDRSLIKGTLTVLGFADNTIGLLLMGRPFDGQLEYMIGVFDDQQFEQFNFGGVANLPIVTRNSGNLMTAGRVVWNLLDPATPGLGRYADYRGSWVGAGQRLAIAGNFACLADATFDVGAGPTESSDISAWGVDLFFNSGPWVFQGEFDEFIEGGTVSHGAVHGMGWYVQGGYLLNYHQYVNCECHHAIEIAARFQEADTLLPADGHLAERRAWTSIGLNYYLRDHNLKIQTDCTIKRERDTEVDNDIFQMQLQLNY
jgi:hypothetical protein